MFQLINAVSQSFNGLGALLVLAVEFAALAAIVFLVFRGWEKYQEGQHIRGPLRMDIIENRRRDN